MVSIPFVSRVGPVAAVNPEDLPTRGAAVLARSTLAALSGLVFQSGISAMSYPTDVTRDILPKVSPLHEFALLPTGFLPPHVPALLSLAGHEYLTRSSLPSEYPFS